jgi:tRNA (guanine37-N1)-methyltransferase
MRITILTLFPEMFAPLNSSILGKAQEKNLVDIDIVNIRDYSLDKHHNTDDYPFGGGAGMVMFVQPIYDAIKKIKENRNPHVVYLSPKGTTLNQKKVIELSSKYDDIVFLCGHYEGIDERAITLCVDEEISIGDYVLTGGELPAMVITDAICRYIPKVLHSDKSTIEESFSNDLLEYPQYTRPKEFMGLTVPDVLLSGNHQEVDKWRMEQSLEITKLKRPDLLKKRKDKNEN